MFYFESVIALTLILCFFSVITQLCNLRKELSILINIDKTLTKTLIFYESSNLIKYNFEKWDRIDKKDKPVLKGRGIARPFEPGEIKRVYKMLDKAVSPKKIAKRLNRSLSSIFLYKRKWKSKRDTSN